MVRAMAEDAHWITVNGRHILIGSHDKFGGGHGSGHPHAPGGKPANIIARITDTHLDAHPPGFVGRYVVKHEASGYRRGFKDLAKAKAWARRGIGG
jgi:hypothetical protein